MQQQQCGLLLLLLLPALYLCRLPSVRMPRRISSLSSMLASMLASASGDLLSRSPEALGLPQDAKLTTALTHR